MEIDEHRCSVVARVRLGDIEEVFPRQAIVQDALRGKEALEYRSMEYEREGMVTELLKRPHSNATALSDASLTSLHDGVPPPPPFRSCPPWSASSKDNSDENTTEDSDSGG